MSKHYDNHSIEHSIRCNVPAYYQKYKTAKFYGETDKAEAAMKHLLVWVEKADEYRVHVKQEVRDLIKQAYPPAQTLEGTSVTITLTADEFLSLKSTIVDTLEVYEDTVKDEDFMDYEDRKAMERTIANLKSMKEKFLYGELSR